MHKFFCNFNTLTQRYELSQNRSAIGGIFSPRVGTQAENNLLNEIKALLQELYKNIVIIKEKEENEERLNLLEETELLISNLYYSLFASPLDLPEKQEVSAGNELAKAIEVAKKLQKSINIPEYNRLCVIIGNNLSSLL